MSSFSPAPGAIGARVTVTGSGFTGATKVTFGGAASHFTVKSDTKITATVPASAATGPIAGIPAVKRPAPAQLHPDDALRPRGA